MTRSIPTAAAIQLEALLPDLLRLARYLLRDRAAAEDMVQDIVLRLWSRMTDPAEPPIDDLRAYAFSALRNRLRDRGATPLNAEMDDALPDPWQTAPCQPGWPAPRRWQPLTPCPPIRPR
jgi:RNA polymerase sigma-70 factor (ECF subfamily)